MDTSFRLWPESASSLSDGVDYLYIFLLLVTGFFTVLICILVWYFAIKYRKKAKVDRTPPKEHILAEISWSVVPFILVMIMFGWGAVLFFEIYNPPPEADEVTVVGKQWMWKIQHPNGKREINELHIPVGRPVKLKMISEDVIHSFYVPAFRVKQDVLPGRYTSMWFEPTKVGTYHLFCAEYCGTSHSGMIGKVVVMEPADFAEWLAGDGTGQPPEVAGQALYDKYRCGSCHSSSAGARCPPLEGIYGQVREFENADSVTVDDEYLRESILNPMAKIVKGYRGRAIMPTYKGSDGPGEEGVIQLIAYIKSLGQPSGSSAPSSPSNDSSKVEAELPDSPTDDTPKTKEENDSNSS